MRIKHIELGDFASHLGPRYRYLGEHSGEEFREEWLLPSVKENDRVIVGLDSIKGYTSSFLEEAFGGLVRELGYDAVRKKLQFLAVRRAYLIPLIESWMRDAAQEKPQRKR